MTGSRIRPTTISVFVLLVAGLVLIAIFKPFSRGVPDGAPTEASLGRAAVAGGLTTEESAAPCVADLIRHSRVSVRTMRYIVSNPADWTVPEGRDHEFFSTDVEGKMRGKCDVEPWPGVDRWPDDPQRS